MTQSAIFIADVTIPVPTRLRFIAACPASGCGCLAGSPHARVCVRADCGMRGSVGAGRQLHEVQHG